MGHMYLSGDTAVKIAASIEDAVRGDRAREGDRLPSVREAAALLGVNRNTVGAAYTRLRNAGLIVGGIGRGGMRVASTTPFEARTFELPEGVCDLASGNVDASLLPSLQSVLDSVDLTPTGYDAEGDDPTLLALARERFGAENLDTRNICFLSGALDAIERAVRAHLRPGATVLVEDPGFPPLFELLRSLGMKLRPMPVDQEGPDPSTLAEGLRAGAAAVVITPRAQNPSGCDVSPKRAAALSAVLARHPECLLIIDDHWGPIAEGPLALRPREDGPWLFVRSVSKFLGPDYRLAIAVGDETTIARVRRQQALGPRWVSRLLQRMAAALWQSSATDELLVAARAAYSERRTVLLEELAAAGVTAFGASGVHVWVPVSREAEVVQAMLARGWAVQAGEPFRLESGPAVRIGVSNLTPVSAKRVARDLAQCLSGPRRFVS